MNKIKEFRKKLNVTQKEMATKLGISQQAYGQYEAENKIPSDEILSKISEILNVSKNDLISKTIFKKENMFSLEEYLENSFTSYHSTENAINILKNNGFVELNLADRWNLKETDKCFVQINQSAFIAFKVGDLSSYQFNIAGSHTDSPSLHIKGNSLISSQEGMRINVEMYGGLLLYSMLDIPLKIAGRVLTKEGNTIKSEIIASDFNVNIPSLCIHHNPGANKDLSLSVQNDMLPLLGKCDDLYKAIYPNAEILDADLYCVPNVKSYYSGIEKEYLVSSRIDNLTSVYSSIQALIEANNKGIAIVFASDNEEIGSETKQGACSVFLENVLNKINSSLNKTEEDFSKAIQNGFLLSIDNGHAAHPANMGKSDIDQKVFLNKGIVIKHHVNYSTDGVSSSIVKMICKNNDIMYQDFYNNSDVRCGGTIGLVISSKLAMNSCDIGLAQLGMHSAIETVGRDDIYRMQYLIKSFFETSINKIGENYSIK